MIDVSCKVCKKTYKRNIVKIRSWVCYDCNLCEARKKYLLKREENGFEVNKFERLFNQGKKECSICKKIELFSLFSKSNSNKCGLRSSCKKCDANFNKKYEKNNKDKININRRNRRKSPTSGVIFTQRSRQKGLFKNTGAISKPATKIIREWLGCSIDEAVNHIESQFAEGMTWGNRGIYMGQWQIDHIFPVSFSITANGKLIDCDLNRHIWHYKNLQPLWKVDNLAKSNKHPMEFECYLKHAIE